MKLKKEANGHVVYKFLGIKIKIRRDDSKLFPYNKRQPEISRYKYVHLMNNGLHTKNIINFVNTNFNQDEHCFVFVADMYPATKEKFKDIKNVFHCSIKNINFNKVSKIIIHGLFDLKLAKELYKNKKYLKKTYWFIWGGDLYYKSFDTKENIYVRKNLAGILTSFDNEVFRNKYNVNLPCYDVTYPHEIKEDMITQNLKQRDVVHIQINNSADSTTLEMLDILSKFKDENIKISTILSYITVGQRDFRIQIIKKGYEIFGNKFNPIIDFLPKEDYVNHLASVDIYISNQDRQQGNGNSTFIYSLGGKVFLKNNTSVYKKYNSIGINIFDTYTISNLNFEEFCSFDENEKQKSILILKERMKDETKIKQWRDFFNA